MVERRNLCRILVEKPGEQEDGELGVRIILKRVLERQDGWYGLD
jgi:hypothetical protein